MAERWNPWRALRARPWITFVRAPLPPSTGGAVCATWNDGSSVIAIDSALGRRARREALAHELVHLERGGSCAYLGQADGWSAVVVREERAVERITAGRLVPPAEIIDFVERRVASEIPTTALDVSEEFDMSEQMAELVLRLAKGEVA